MNRARPRLCQANVRADIRFWASGTLLAAAAVMILLSIESASSQDVPQPGADAQPPTTETPAAAPPQSSRLALPPAAQLAPVQTKIRELYGAEIEKAKKPAEKAALAATMLKVANESADDPAARYALLLLSQDFAAAAGDVKAALAVHDQLIEQFELDPVQESTRLLRKWIDHPDANPPGLQDAAQAGLKIAEEYSAKDDYAQALKFARLALEAANKGRYTTLIKQITAFGQEQTAKQTELLEIPKLEQKLAADPNDLEANMQLGRWYWFRKRDPFSAMPYLAKTADSPLKKAAQAELENPLDATAQSALADQWWALAQTVKDDAIKNAIRARALDWYQLAVPRLTGFDKVKAERRIAELKSLLPTVASAAPNKNANGEITPMTAADRLKMALAAGGSKESEAAVEQGLKWIASVQAKDGGWNFDTRTVNPGVTDAGSADQARNGATALALLPFLAAGYTHKSNNPYQANIKKGIAFLLQNTNPKYTNLQAGSVAWFEDQGTMYSHGLAAAAICEAYALTKDRALLPYAQGSVNFIVAVQDPQGGGWRYAPRQPGDTSVHGWQVMALKSAAMGNLKINPLTIQGAVKFLDTVSDAKDSRAYYGYTGPGKGVATTAIGLLCRMHTGWKKEHPGLKTGVEYLTKLGPHKFNFYFNYYANHVLYQYGGEEWDKWNAALRDQIVKAQVAAGPDSGSWHPGSKDHSTEKGGRLYNTALACLMLEVYYRYPRVLEKKSGELGGLVY